MDCTYGRHGPLIVREALILSIVNPLVKNNRIYENVLLSKSHERDVRLGSKGREKGGHPRMTQKSALIKWPRDNISIERTRWLYLQKMDQLSMVITLWTLCQKSISMFLSTNQDLTDQLLVVYFPKTSW